MTVESGSALEQVQDTAAAGGLHIEEWGTGASVVLVHGSLATGAEEWVPSTRSLRRHFASWSSTGAGTVRARSRLGRTMSSTPTTSSS